MTPQDIALIRRLAAIARRRAQIWVECEECKGKRGAPLFREPLRKEWDSQLDESSDIAFSLEASLPDEVVP